MTKSIQALRKIMQKRSLKSQTYEKSEVAIEKKSDNLLENDLKKRNISNIQIESDIDVHKKLSKIDSSDNDHTRLNNKSTVYVEGLPYSTSEDELRSFFSQVGHIKSVRLPRWHDSGKLKGYGHIEFCDEIAADKALGLDGSYLGGRYIKIDKPMSPRSSNTQSTGKIQLVRPPGCRSIFIKNIPYDANEEDIKNAIMVCGQIKDIRITKWGHTQLSKGFAYVDFKREESAEIAVKKSGILKIKDRTVSIDFETGIPKRSFKKE